MADRRRRAMVLGLSLALVVAVLLTWNRVYGDSQAASDTAADVVRTDDDGMNGAVLTTPYRLADATLTDSSEQPFRLRTHLTEPLTLVFFGYTHCPDICQAVMADLASTMARLDESEAQEVAVWFVTTDPARDDPPTLRSYLDRFDPRFEGLTGPLQDIVRVAGSVRVAVEHGPKLPSGGYDITHGTPVLGVREDGSVPIVWTEGTSASRLAEDVHVLLTNGVPSSGGGA